jgi:SNF2 family DNA or RNA helicase
MRQLLPGTEVNARGLRWEIVSVQPLGDQMLYRLRGLEHAILGKELDLLSPFEPILPLITEIQPEKATTLRNWLVYHQAFLLEQSLGGSAFTAVQPGRLKLEDYQLVPVLRALNMSRARLLLCDDVGLGKTIQAALVITELVARRMAHRILIVSPAGPLLEQWKCELWERFGLRVEIIDRAKLEEVRRENELGANPFDHIPLGLVSIDFLKQEKILGQLERSSYDVIVVDEAAHVNDTGNTQDREASQRRKLAEVLARKSDALLLLTATPHDGYDRSFASLLELLDPSLVDARGVIRPERYKPHVIRRLKEHIRDRQSGDLKFKLRQVFPVAVVSTDIDNPKFVELQKALIDLIAPELRRAFRRRDYSNVLAFIALLKRSVSTARACQNTLKVIADRFGGIEKTGVEDLESRKQRLKTLRDYHREIQRFGTTSVEQEEELAQLEAEDIAQQLASLQKEVSSGTYRLKRNASVTGALRELIVLAEQSQAQDPKIHGVIEKIREIRTECPAANVLVYTEYADSQAALVDALKKEMGIGGVLAISGQDSDKDRARITDIFRTSDNQILVSTDATSEGLNLHQRCHYLLHLELPFNPNRLEQRNGRIDRYGQGFNPIIYYFYLQGTFEEKILLRLIAKYEKQRSKLHFLPNTLGLATNADASYERLLRGLLDEDSNLFKPDLCICCSHFKTDPSSKDNISVTSNAGAPAYVLKRVDVLPSIKIGIICSSLCAIFKSLLLLRYSVRDLSDNLSSIISGINL